MEIIDKATQEEKDYEYISAGTLLKDQQETVWLVTDEIEPSQRDRIIVDIETGETDYWEDVMLTSEVNNGMFLIISKSELSILAYE